MSARRLLPLLLALGAVAGLGCATLEGAWRFRSGSEALDRGEIQQAVAELERAARLAPGAAPVLNNLGVAYLAAGRTAEAERAFERAVALDCGHQPAQRNLRALQAEPRRETVARRSSP